MRVAPGAKIKRKATMAAHSPVSGACTVMRSAQTLRGTTIWTRSGFLEGGHQLEKLEFALAIAEARGDLQQCSRLRDRIADLGGNAEEPGT